MLWIGSSGIDRRMPPWTKFPGLGPENVESSPIQDLSSSQEPDPGRRRGSASAAAGRRRDGGGALPGDRRTRARGRRDHAGRLEYDHRGDRADRRPSGRASRAGLKAGARPEGWCSARARCSIRCAQGFPLPRMEPNPTVSDVRPEIRLKGGSHGSRHPALAARSTDPDHHFDPAVLALVDRM